VKVVTMRNESKLTIEEKATVLFQVDPLLPAQYFDTFRSRADLGPERVLMLAVLGDAITCIQKYGPFPKGKEKRWFRETMDWIVTQNNDWLFSFDGVCEALDLDAASLRVALTRIAESNSDKSHKPQGPIKKKDRIVRPAA
jgi:hypothetical protein